ncbi:PTS sugar transporter subunit IIA [Loigolactobacillus coryniformis]|uniref:PTS sugar transporter subunit IIA n=1 Tax=Loigolactobacillus coryniformis TaxID=1610 RepID=UPI00049583A7|nr:fructose PTS transporter subunit IIA [Loigolactobacillus coryniformis]
MSDLIQNNINLHSQARTKEEALKELCKELEKNNVVSDKILFYQAVQEREAIGPTGMENGIAIPHGESDVVNRAAIAVLKTNDGLVWESLDNQPIKLIFLLVVPTIDRNIEHLKILSRLSAALTHKEVQDKLLCENDIVSFKKILQNAGGM